MGILSPWPMYSKLFGNLACDACTKFCHAKNIQKPAKNHPRTMKNERQKTMFFSTSLFLVFFVILVPFWTPKWDQNGTESGLLRSLDAFSKHVRFTKFAFKKLF